MSDFIKKVKATYLKLYQQKYGRTDTAFLDPHFILSENLSAEMSKPHWGSRPVYVIKRKDPQQLFVIDFPRALQRRRSHEWTVTVTLW